VHRASDETALRRDLEKRGLHVFEVRPRGLPVRISLPSLPGRRKRMPTQDFLVFNQELAALLGAGLPLLQVLDLMVERVKHPGFHDALRDVRERVESGEELSAAFAAQGDMFPRLYSSSLVAGERTGDLETVIRRFVRYMQLVLEARKRVASALVYPAVLVALSMAMIAVMAIYVVPRFEKFYADLDAELPVVTRVTLGVAGFLASNWLWLALVLVAVGFLFHQWAQTPIGRVSVDRWRLGIPFFGQVFHRFGIAELSRSLATLLEGGMPLVPSLEIAVGSVGNAYLRSRLSPCIQLVREGRALYSALEESRVVEDLAVDMVRVGEATGSLGSMLSSLSDFLDQEVEIRMQRLLSLVEPLMLVFMGLIIALLLISVYLPMYSVIGQVQG
jgi:type IV pilus assembly protein PilC